MRMNLTGHLLQRPSLDALDMQQPYLLSWKDFTIEMDKTHSAQNKAFIMVNTCNSFIVKGFLAFLKLFTLSYFSQILRVD